MAGLCISEINCYAKFQILILNKGRCYDASDFIGYQNRHIVGLMMCFPSSTFKGLGSAKRGPILRMLVQYVGAKHLPLVLRQRRSVQKSMLMKLHGDIKSTAECFQVFIIETCKGTQALLIEPTEKQRSLSLSAVPLGMFSSMEENVRIVSKLMKNCTQSLRIKINLKSRIKKELISKYSDLEMKLNQRIVNMDT